MSYTMLHAWSTTVVLYIGSPAVWVALVIHGVCIRFNPCMQSHQIRFVIYTGWVRETRKNTAAVADIQTDECHVTSSFSNKGTYGMGQWIALVRDAHIEQIMTSRCDEKQMKEGWKKGHFTKMQYFFASLSIRLCSSVHFTRNRHLLEPCF